MKTLLERVKDIRAVLEATDDDETIESYYDFETGEFPQGGYLYFDIKGEDFNVEDDLRGDNGPDAKKDAEKLFKGKDMGDVWADLEMKALREMSRILGARVTNEGHGSDDALVCKVPVESYKEFAAMWKKLRFGSEDELTLDTPYFVARGFELILDPGMDRWAWDWDGTRATKESIGDFLTDYKPGKKRK